MAFCWILYTALFFFFYIISPLFYDTLILNESRKLESYTIDYPDFVKHYYKQPSPLF